MKINRLFEIVYILLNKKTITARELSEHFEVSVRTIYRDIDSLLIAEITIYKNKGKSGDISLIDEFEHENIRKNPDESFTVTITFPESDWIYGYAL